MSFFEKVLQVDRELFFLINNKWANSFFDLILPYSRNAITWIPFYLFLLTFILLNHKKKAWLWILLAIATAAATDLISSRLIKQNIFRLRPCHDMLLHHVRFLVQYCPQSSSFTSSHAANHFGLSTFIYQTLNRLYGKWVAVIFLWAFLISYAQIYVGVHYPLDVIGGAMVGVIVGYLTGKLYQVNEGMKRAG
jgi:membrane-associated phospholipid phosphatase